MRMFTKKLYKRNNTNTFTKSVEITRSCFAGPRNDEDGGKAVLQWNGYDRPYIFPCMSSKSVCLQCVNLFYRLANAEKQERQWRSMMQYSRLVKARTRRPCFPNAKWVWQSRFPLLCLHTWTQFWHFDMTRFSANTAISVPKTSKFQSSHRVVKMVLNT